MEPSNAVDEMYQRRKRCWLSYGRAMLTIGILGLLTVGLVVATQSNSGEDSNVDGVNDRIGSKSVSDDEVMLRKIVKRNVESVPKNAESVQSLNDVNSEDNSVMDEQHMKLLKRQQQGSNQNYIQHRHSDGDVYFFKGYKCVPIRKTTSKYYEALSLRQRQGSPGMLCLCYRSSYSLSLELRLSA
jgi:hypothetical protein